MRFTAAAGGLVSLAAAFALVVWLTGGTSRSGIDAKSPEAKDPAKDEFPSNPYPKITQGPAPKVEVESSEHEFGLMKLGDEGAHDFVVKNVGDAPLKLAKGPSTCQCTMSALSELVVPPGGSTVVTLTWKPEGVNEAFRKQATIWTNDPSLWEKTDESFRGEGEIVFTVSGKVFNSVEVEPSEFTLGTLDETQPTVVEAHVFSRVTKDLEVSLQETSSEVIDVEIESVPAEKLKEKDALTVYLVKCTIEPRLSVGRVRESITLKTNDNITPIVTIGITGFRQGPVTIGGRYWNQAYSMIDFENFDAAQGVATTLNVYTPQGDEKLGLELASKKPEWLEVEVESHGLEPELPSLPDEDRREWHSIKVRVPPGRPPERLIGSDAGTLVFKTNLEEVPEIKIRVVYESR
jgi:hypothetical protein